MDEERPDHAAPTADEGHPAGAVEIDIAQLAERVYRLFRDEIRLEQARGGSNTARRGRR